MCYSADGYLKRGSHDAAMLVELQNLSLFFGTQNKVTSLLKEKLEPVLAFEEVIGDTVNMCLQLFENDIYLLPHEKHMLLKVSGSPNTLQYTSMRQSVLL